MWSPGRPRRTRLRRTNALSSPSLAGPTRLPPAEAAAAEPAAATVLAAPSPTSDVVGLGRWRALGFVAPALVLLAWILPSSVVAFLWIALLDRDEGTVNVLIGQTPGVAWLVQYPMTGIVVFNICRGTAFSMMLYAAALSSVPPSHLETARLAGSSTAQTLRDVVLPHLRRYALTNTLLITLWTFNDFTPFLLTAGGPNGRSEIVAAYIYNTAILGGDMGYSGAISLLVLLINLLLALVYLRAARAGRGAK